MSVDQAATTQILPPVTVTATAPIKAFSEGDEGPSFKDVLDIINPLQHIPIINTIYRHITGDEEGAVADVAGGALWAGPIGLVGSMVDLAVKADSGRSIGDNILHWLGLDDDEDTAKTQTAQQQQAQQAQQQQTAVAVAPPPAVTIQALAALPARQRGDDKADRKDARRDDDAIAGNQPISLTPSSQPAAPVLNTASADKDAAGPSRQGQFMVFGGGNQPAAPVTVEAPAAPAQTASADGGAIGHQGEYWVFGATAAPATPARPVQLAQAAAYTPAPMPMVSAAVTNNAALPPIGSPNVNAVANSVPPSGGPAQLSPMPARTFAAPARRTQVTPNALPMPTTGTGALPGHMSQAIQSPTNNDNSSWFAQAFNAGLDKYAAAQRLAGQDNMAASAAAGASAQSIH